jgi:hypothetical protein
MLKIIALKAEIIFQYLETVISRKFQLCALDALNKEPEFGQMFCSVGLIL